MDGARNRNALTRTVMGPLSLQSSAARMRIAAARSLAVISIGLPAFVATTAQACPDCSVGRVARAQLWNDRFMENLFIAVAPFLVMLIVAACAERLAGHRASEEEET